MPVQSDRIPLVGEGLSFGGAAFDPLVSSLTIDGRNECIAFSDVRLLLVAKERVLAGWLASCRCDGKKWQSPFFSPSRQFQFPNFACTACSCIGQVSPWCDQSVKKKIE